MDTCFCAYSSLESLSPSFVLFLTQSRNTLIIHFFNKHLSAGCVLGTVLGRPTIRISESWFWPLEQQFSTWGRGAAFVSPKDAQCSPHNKESVSPTCQRATHEKPRSRAAQPRPSSKALSDARYFHFLLFLVHKRTNPF